MRKSVVGKLVPVLLIAAAITAYFGVRYVTASSGLTALSPKETTREYRAEAASLRLAPGWTWPARPIRSVAFDGRGIMYEKGYGTQAADYYWYCSWAGRALDQAVGSSARREAVAEALRIRDKYYFETALAPVSRPAFDAVLDSAAAGDLRGLRRDYQLNCPKAPE